MLLLGIFSTVWGWLISYWSWVWSAIFLNVWAWSHFDGFFSSLFSAFCVLFVFVFSIVLSLFPFAPFVLPFMALYEKIKGSGFDLSGGNLGGDGNHTSVPSSQNQATTPNQESIFDFWKKQDNR